MIKRIVEISSEPLELSIRNEQLVLRLPERAGGGVKTTIPCEDIGVLILEHPHVVCTQSAVSRLMEYGATAIFCGRDYLPNGIALPISGNTEVVSRLRDQINASRPVRKRLWKELVCWKVLNQAGNLPHAPLVAGKLQAMAKEVRSGDMDNVEAQAAKIYWSAWLKPKGVKKEFRRVLQNGCSLNAQLNYGYAILRACLGRAIVSAGLTPALGVHHHHRANAFALADDLIEPLRPWVDAIVQERYEQGDEELNKDAKRALLGLLHKTVSFNGNRGPLMVSLHRYVNSFLRCLRGEEARLTVPVMTDEF